MVFICTTTYPSDNESQYREKYAQFPHELHDFQKWAIEALIKENHVLVTAPTGTGKSVVAEFAIRHFVGLGKKVIYCSPIKALSNQKFYDFTRKFPDISVGIITGDISCNTSADVLIMTTEILLNKLYCGKTTTNTSTSFDMNIETELRCVVFDEIHMINDPSRGHVWEQSIMMMPSHVQIVGLSATLDDPVKFASWIETQSAREIYLAVKTTRTVPLTHYSFITVSNSAFKVIKDKTVQAEINGLINQPFIIQSATGAFNDAHYSRMSKVLTLLGQKSVRVSRGHVLNKVSEYLVQNEMLPALCYVFSRKQLEICAKELTTNLLEFDSKIPYTIDYECEQIIRKLPNFQEYLHLPEYVEMVQLLRKGVAMHHSGIIPILREMVELLFARGMIKILFCTESVAIGLNLPVKTTIFTDVSKHDGKSIRMLHGHEYTQAAGRAGRLGIDTVGHVIHLNNLFRNAEIISYKTMLKGAPQTLTSHFKLSYHLVFELIQQGKRPTSFSHKSLIQGDVQSEIEGIKTELECVKKDIGKLEESIKHIRTPTGIVREYIGLQHDRPQSINKKRKDIDRRIQCIKDEHRFIDSDMTTITVYDETRRLMGEKEVRLSTVEQYVETNVGTTIDLLERRGFLRDKVLTVAGHYASALKEVHCLVFADLLVVRYFENKDVSTLVELFSCFTNVSVQEQFKETTVPESMQHICGLYDDYLKEECALRLNSGIEYDLQYDLMPYMREWCKSQSVEECKWVLQTMAAEKGIFLGEFVKALLKINNIAVELGSIAEKMGDIALLSVLKAIPEATLKFVVTNQSLYV
jgi:superfamily II RNA helicase